MTSSHLTSGGWLLDEAEDGGDVGRGAVVRPAGVLVLGHLPHRPTLPPPALQPRVPQPQGPNKYYYYY